MERVPRAEATLTKMITFRALASSSAGCCYVLTSSARPDAPLLIDAGIRYPSIQRALDFKVSGLAGALISHCHGDHSDSVPNLLKAGVNVYSSQDTWNELRVKCQKANAPQHRAKAINADAPFQVGPWNVRAFDAVHDAPGTFGFLIAGPCGKKLLYLTDTGYSKYRFEGVHIMAVECNHSREIARQNAVSGAISLPRYSRTVTNHLSLERLLDLLKANDLSAVEEIHLLHLSDANSDEVEFKLAVQKATGKPTFIAAKHGEEVHG